MTEIGLMNVWIGGSIFWSNESLVVSMGILLDGF